MKCDKMRRSAQLLSGVAVLAIGSAAAQTADDPQKNSAALGSGTTIREVTVTAEHRSTSAQRVAASISVRSGTELLRQGKATLAEILENVPGVVGGATVGQNSTGTDTPGSGVTIRGLGANVGGGGDPTSVPATTALYTDGVYNGAGSQYDIARVEVLRGPQGTLYGRSATGGVVATYTNDPNLSAIGGYLLGEYGDFGLRHSEGALNVPLIKDELALRVSAYHYERQGYFNGPGGANQSNDARAKLLYRPNADLRVLLGFAAGFDHIRTGGTFFTQAALNGPVNGAPGAFGVSYTNQRQFWGQLDWNFGAATLTDIMAFRNWHQLGANVLSSPAFNAINPVSTPVDDTITEELRLASQPGGALSWQGGVFYYGNLVKDSSEFLYNTGSLSYDDQVKKVTRNPGVFAESTYKITPSLRFTAGLRYDYAYVHRDQFYLLNTDENDAHDPASDEHLISTTISGPLGGRSYSNVTYRVRLEDDLTPRNMIYASVASAASAGDVFATTASTPSGQPDIAITNLQSETVTSYELGSKNRFWDNRIQANGDIYYATYGGYQQAGVNVGTNPFYQIFQTLVSPMHLAGVEAEFQSQLSAYDSFAANISY